MKRADIHPYDTGFTPWVTSRHDPRFCWSLYVPKSASDDTPAPLLVLVHDVLRNDYFRPGYRDYAERTGTVLLTPLFPLGAAGPGDLHGFKELVGHGLRYDLLLLDMIDEAAAMWNLQTERFAIHGYSAGGQCVHRFLLVHPDRISAASVGAPGSITLPDESRPWPAGVQDFEACFGKSFDPAALANVPVHLVIGADDTDVKGITRKPGDAAYAPGVNDETTNRPAKLRKFDAALRALGCTTRHEVVEGVGHNGKAMIPSVTAWLDEVLAKG